MKRIFFLLALVGFASPGAAQVFPDGNTPSLTNGAYGSNYPTGFYIGAQAGVAYQTGGSDPRFAVDTNFDGVINNQDQDVRELFTGIVDDKDDAFIGGVRVGYDYRMGKAIVGAIADLSYLGVERENSFNFLESDFSLDEDVGYLATIRARAGVVFDNILIYGTGGVAFGGYDRDFHGSTTGNFQGFTYREQGDDADFGYTFGAGIDFSLTRTVSMGAEYLYTNLGSSDYRVSAFDDTGDLAFQTTSSDDEISFHSVSATLTYHFN